MSARLALLAAPLLAALVACGTNDVPAPSPGATSAGALSDGLVVKTAVELDSDMVLSGQTVHARVTYVNPTPDPITVRTVAIAARPPGGSHAGGPYLDFLPYAPETTVVPGGILTVQASRTFADEDPTGTWDLYPTWQDEDGAWHDGADASFVVGASVAPPPGGGNDDGGAPLVQPPVANATQGTWESGDLDGVSYRFMLPSGYSTAKRYPLVLYLHQLANASQIPEQIEPWFDDLGFRTNHPAIVVAPKCENSSADINWGGVSGDEQPCQKAAIAIVDRFLAQYSVHPAHVYVTGNSMGGIGSWDLIIKYNAKNPTIRPLFAATLILAGATYAWGYPNPDPSVVQRLRDVPIWAIHGAGDNQVPRAWDENMFAAEQAIGGKMKLLVDPNAAHDVWDTHYVMPKAETYWSWLFAQ